MTRMSDRIKIIFATGNEDKMREVREIIGEAEIPVLSMKEAGINADIEETGRSFEENALIKARAVASVLKNEKNLPRDDETDTRYIVMADDSGLVIDALNGEPGIYSARYAGHDTPYEEKNALIISRLFGIPDEKRTARYVCAIAAVFPDGAEETARGTMEGSIAYEPAGKNGFGYDPIFYVPEYDRTAAEISPDEKNLLSHRGKALRAMRDIIRGRRGV